MAAESRILSYDVVLKESISNLKRDKYYLKSLIVPIEVDIETAFNQTLFRMFELAILTGGAGVKDSLLQKFKFILLRKGESLEDGLHTRIFVYDSDFVNIKSVEAPPELVGAFAGDATRRQLYRSAQYSLAHGGYTFIPPAELRETEIIVPQYFYGYKEITKKGVR